jgi:DNA-binding response OmpR family regulator
MNSPSYHILVVDDDPILQSYIEINLTQRNHHVSQLSEGEEIETVLQQHTIDLIILDVLLPGKDGFYWLEWLHSQYPAMDILILSAKKSDNDRVQGLELGALDYLPKPFHIKELLIRIENILQRSPNRLKNSNNSNIVVKFGEFQFDSHTNTLTKRNQSLRLTPCEAELLAVLYQHQDQIVTRDQLAQALTGHDHSPLDRRIDVHISRLRNKIEEDPSSPVFIRTVWGKGYQFYTPSTH